MKTRAAVLRTSPGEFEITEVDLDEPRQGELLVKLAASGLCHSDDHMLAGDLPVEHLPMVGGHEGAGVVEAVGPNTVGWSVGDHVIFSFVPFCGRCRWCASGMSNLCNYGAFTMRGSRFDDPDSFRFSVDGVPTGQFCALGTFSNKTVISVLSAIKIDKSLPLDKMCLLGCGVGTGWGSAVYEADVSPGETVLVMGIGGVGINAVQGAVHAGATVVVAVDPNQFKLDMAYKFGATHAFTSMEEATDFARSVTDGQGADKAIVTVGTTLGEHIAQAFASIRKAGTVVVTGVGNMTETSIPISPLEITFYQKRIHGAVFGATNPAADIPRQIDMYLRGQLMLDELITRTYRLEEVNEGYADLRDGKNIRGVILFDGA